MVPEAWESGNLWLYNTTKEAFPFGWQRVEVIIGGPLVDVSLVPPEMPGEPWFLFGQVRRVRGRTGIFRMRGGTGKRVRGRMGRRNRRSMCTGSRGRFEMPDEP